uniref:cAMP responsive element modulator n=2 Tax=Esox lucius TaxID=8010 RepID=A0AAY5K5M5_ESOLU
MASIDSQVQEQASSGVLSALAQVARRRANLEAKNEDVSNIHKRRERLSRRQTCREVSPDTVVTKVEEIQEEVAPCNVTPAPIRPASVYQTNHGQFIAFTQDGAIQISSAFPGGLQGLQPLPLSNSVKPQSAAAIVQYSQETGDVSQQFFMQGNNVLVQAATGEMSGYQICTPTSSLPQGVVMVESPGSMHSPQQMAEEATRKRELRLMKNREAARECRRKKKEYVKCLENRVAVLENQNRTLIEELKALKDIYCRKPE